MQIIICGAGKSGSSIAEKLSQLGNEVTIIDSSPELVKKFVLKTRNTLNKLTQMNITLGCSYCHHFLPSRSRLW